MVGLTGIQSCFIHFDDAWRVWVAQREPGWNCFKLNVGIKISQKVHNYTITTLTMSKLRKFYIFMTWHVLSPMTICIFFWKYSSLFSFAIQLCLAALFLSHIHGSPFHFNPTNVILYIKLFPPGHFEKYFDLHILFNFLGA